MVVVQVVTSVKPSKNIFNLTAISLWSDVIMVNDDSSQSGSRSFARLSVNSQLVSRTQKQHIVYSYGND